MVKLVFKSCLYFFLILLVLEGVVRAFHLHQEFPEEYVANDGLNKWRPKQEGHSVYGNRRQVFAEYQINSSGYNSYREFKPSKNKRELALLGDSYIEGFHQNYNNSIGKKIESKLKGLEVYEYGHSSNDFADQMRLIEQNKSTFDLIDHIIIRIKFEKDLLRSRYEPVERKPLFMALRKSKLVVYLLNIGITESIKKIHRGVMSIISGSQTIDNVAEKEDIDARDRLSLENFKTLIKNYDFDKDKITILIDSRATSKEFGAYLEKENISYIDYSVSFKNAGKKPTTLIYDQHWNDYGRTLVANDIVTFLLKENIYTQNKN